VADLSKGKLPTLDVDPAMAVGGLEPAGDSDSNLAVAAECMSYLSKPTPAAAIICGLRGLDDELAMLPFLECWMPWTMEVWRWCPYVTALGSKARSWGRGDVSSGVETALGGNFRGSCRWSGRACGGTAVRRRLSAKHLNDAKQIGGMRDSVPLSQKARADNWVQHRMDDGGVCATTRATCY
jgi:hypothetical protein